MQIIIWQRKKTNLFPTHPDHFLRFGRLCERAHSERYSEQIFFICSEASLYWSESEQQRHSQRKGRNVYKGNERSASVCLLSARSPCCTWQENWTFYSLCSSGSISLALLLTSYIVTPFLSSDYHVTGRKKKKTHTSQTCEKLGDYVFHYGLRNVSDF